MENSERLTDSEEIVMKSIWDCKKEPELRDVLERTNGFYGKDWKPQTVSTYLTKLCGKNYIKLQRNGKIYTYKVLVNEEDYRCMLYRQHISFWNNNDVVDFIREMLANKDLTSEDLQQAIKKKKNK